MDKKRKIILFIASGIAGLAIVAFLGIKVVNHQYAKNIPDYPDSSDPSLELKEQIQDAIKKAHHKPSAKNLGELGMVFHSSANYTEAAQCYQLAIEKSKSDWKWNYYLAHLYKELGEPDVVVENLNRVLDINPDVNLAWYYLGEVYKNLGENDLAEKAFSKIRNINDIPASKYITRIDYFPLSAYATFQLSKIYIAKGKTELAEENLKKLLDQNELFGAAYRLLGNIYSMKGDISLGEEFNVMANDVYPFFTPVDTLVDKLALVSRSELYLLKKIDEAMQNSYIDWGLRLVQHGFEYMPDNKYLVSKAIEIYIKKGQKQKARELSILHKNAFKEEYVEMSRMGMIFFQNEMFKEAGEYLSIVWALNSDNVEILEKVAFSLGKTGYKQKGLEILNEAAEANQNNPDNLAGIAYTFFRFGNIEQAVFYLNKLKRLAPENPKVQKLAGKIAETKGNLAAALENYEAAFIVDPNDNETIDYLGNLLLHYKMWNKYLAFSKEVLKYHPNNPTYLDNLGSFLIACPDQSLQNVDEGIKYSQRAFNTISSSPSLKIASGRNLAISYANKGDKQDALKTIKKTIEIGRNTNASAETQEDLSQIHQFIQNL